MEDGIITKGSELGEQETEKTVLRPFSVGSLPSIYYIPDFVSPAEQNHLLHQVNGAPVTKWKMLKNRRLQNWGLFKESHFLQFFVEVWSLFCVFAFGIWH
jgi:hypothetical protein